MGDTELFSLENLKCPAYKMPKKVTRQTAFYSQVNGSWRQRLGSSLVLILSGGDGVPATAQVQGWVAVTFLCRVESLEMEAQKAVGKILTSWADSSRLAMIGCKLLDTQVNLERALVSKLADSPSCYCLPFPHPLSLTHLFTAFSNHFSLLSPLFFYLSPSCLISPPFSL